MSKIYDALLKAQREQTLERPVEISSETESNQEVLNHEKAAVTEERSVVAPALVVPAKESEKKSAKRRDRIVTRVSVGPHVAKPNSVSEEQFRKLKSTITSHHLAKSLRSVLVTSCLPAEGKSTVALNLAAILARGLDDSAVLIDADLRRLSLTELLGLRKAPGLSDILEERINIVEALLETEIQGLTILPGGTNPGGPAELIGSNRMRNLLQEIRQVNGGSYVIIDSTPLVSTSEAHSLSQMVDGVIAVIMADETRRDIVKRELAAIPQNKMLGVVLNCAEFESSDYYHKYHKHYAQLEEK